MIPGSWPSPFRSLRVALAIVGVLAAAVNVNTLLNDFAYDDRPIIVENEGLHDLSKLPGTLVEPYWPNEYGRELGLWRPVTTGLFALQLAVWGERPMPFHLLNVLLHVAVTMLGVVVLAQLVPLGTAFVAGAIFAVHPVHVEAVANVVGLAELFSTLVFLLACFVFLRARDTLGVRDTLVILGLFAIAFLTKESAVTLPGVLFLLDVVRRDRPARRALAYFYSRGALYGGMVLVTGLVLYSRILVLGRVASPFGPLGAALLENRVPRIWTVASTWPHYFRLLFFPADLSVDYSPAVIPLSYGWDASNLLGVGLVLTTLGVALALARQPTLSPYRSTARTLSFGILWFVVTISPVSNVVFLSGVLMAERTFYLPSIGFAVAVAWTARAWYRDRPRLAVISVVVAVILMGGRTFTRNAAWRDNITVFNTLLREHPESGRAQWLLGDAQFIVGDTAAALKAYSAAISLLNGAYPLLVEVGRRLEIAGQTRTATVLLEQAWRDRPTRGVAPRLLAQIYLNQGRFEEAETAARVAVEFSVGEDGVSNHLLAEALASLERWPEYVEARLKTIEAGEGDQWMQWVWLAVGYASAGDTAQALMALDTARTREVPKIGVRQIDSLAARYVGR
ncbi:MAG: tetratricopeptide repeat protein [Gemmatimonadota bacterium]|nr:MAG: tetratricopeptide repeat protein [Gemmatimonadota bacterium]